MVETYPYRHFIPLRKPVSDDTTYVIIIRNPYDWVRSLHANPYHAQKELWNISFSEFIRAEWISVWDEIAKINNGDPRYGEEIEFERDPISKKYFKNVLHMRSVKYQYWRNIFELTNKCMYIRYEDVVADPSAFLTMLSEMSGLEKKSKTTIPIGRHFNSVPLHRKLLYRASFGLCGGFKKKKYPSISHDDLSFINTHLDWQQEEHCGYEMITEPYEIANSLM